MRDDGITGWELLTMPRRHKDLRVVPIIEGSGDVLALQADEDRLVQNGDVYVLAKPFGLQETRIWSGAS